MDEKNKPPSSEASSRETQTPIKPKKILSYKAAHTVFNTNELLCKIIGHLNFSQIQAVSEVCQPWYDALKADVGIQQALFLAPADPREITTSAHNCLSMRLEDIPRDKYGVVGKHHPLATALCDELLSYNDEGDLEGFPMRRGMKPRYGAPVGILRDMFITQPPIKTININLHMDIQVQNVEIVYYGPTRSYTFQCDEGIKFGKLQDFIHPKMPQDRLRNWNVAIELKATKGFALTNMPAPDDHSSRWEVRNGKVSREIKLIKPYTEDYPYDHEREWWPNDADDYEAWSEPSDGEHSEGEHSEGEHSEGEHSEGEHSEGEHSYGGNSF
jgi:hypothetical protein